MKRFLLLVIGLSIAARLLGQLDVRVTLPQDQYLPGESIEAAVRISNFSGRKINFGANPGWIRFNVEATEGFIVNRISEIQESGEFDLESSTRGTIRYDIQPHFDLSRPGRYRVTAIVRLSDTDEYASTAVHFEVFRGTRLWEREFGVVDNTGAALRRKFLLQQTTNLKDVRLYVRVTDEAETATVKVLLLGNTVSFSRPACAVDRKSQLHVLHQINADTYRYHLIGPDGALVFRHSYEFTERRPQLRVNEGGDVAVIGGARKRSANDLPQEPKTDVPSIKPDEASVTNSPPK